MMKLTYQTVLHRTKNALQFAIVIALLSLQSQTAWGQSWSVNNPESREPVPQYSPSIPANSPSHGIPNTSAFQTDASGQSYPLTPNDPTTSFDPSVPSTPSLRQPFTPLQPDHAPLEAQQIQPPTSRLNYDLGESQLNQKPSREVEWNIYRDRNQFPIDPRKPCSDCVRPAATQPLFATNLPGLKGRPYVAKEPGGCNCEKQNPAKNSEFSVNWPRPFSAKLDTHFPGRAAKRYEPCQESRIVDLFDPLAKLKLSGYQRKDNGYCGRGADPYGCLGESKYAGRVGNSETRVR